MDDDGNDGWWMITIASELKIFKKMLSAENIALPTVLSAKQVHVWVGAVCELTK